MTHTTEACLTLDLAPFYVGCFRVCFEDSGLATASRVSLANVDKSGRSQASVVMSKILMAVWVAVVLGYKQSGCGETVNVPGRGCISITLHFQISCLV